MNTEPIDFLGIPLEAAEPAIELTLTFLESIDFLGILPDPATGLTLTFSAAAMIYAILASVLLATASVLLLRAIGVLESAYLPIFTFVFMSFVSLVVPGMVFLVDLVTWGRVSSWLGQFPICLSFWVPLGIILFGSFKVSLAFGRTTLPQDLQDPEECSKWIDEIEQKILDEDPDDEPTPPSSGGGLAPRRDWRERLPNPLRKIIS
ncbi:MAG: hypothetical protein MK116_07865 [Phycisphaerales bacterium]|nr:hypothetical protein [Phycisphaerales bacterium]